jgi:hypothetical protein
MRVKVYLVQKADDAGNLTGEILAAKLTPGPRAINCEGARTLQGRTRGG